MWSLTRFIAVALICATALGQQSNQSQPAAQSQAAPQPKKQPAQKQAEEPKPEESTAKPAEPAPAQPQPKVTEDKKEEHFDVSEVPPVITHHQITPNGKPLKYTATTGRLPIKRDDGKIEAEMFFVAYVERRPLS
jgi:carboxypeptidase C (cathepsin A)